MFKKLTLLKETQHMLLFSIKEIPKKSDKKKIKLQENPLPV
jgi:hypothetical protein